MHILLAGATGLVGSAVLKAAVADSDLVTAVGRRATGHTANEIITDFCQPLKLPAADIAICALGTTISAAGSKAAFRKIDHTAVMAFATAACQAGVDHFMLVSAVGANPTAGVFYSRVKGETERDLQTLSFSRLDIAQPGLLLGTRSEHRPVEAIMQRVNPVLRHFMLGPLNRYAGIQAKTVAAALIVLGSKNDPGVYRHENRAMQALARDA